MPAKTQVPKCSEMPMSGYHRVQCRNNGVVTEEGKPWCRTHAPSAVAARDVARSRKWDAEEKVRVAREGRATAEAELLGWALAVRPYDFDAGTAANTMRRLWQLQTAVVDARFHQELAEKAIGVSNG